MRKCALIIMMLALLFSCAGRPPENSPSAPENSPDTVAPSVEPAASPPPPAPPPSPTPELTPEEKEELFIASLIDGMDLQEKIAQLFILELGDKVENAGGYVLFSRDITTVEGTRALTEAIAAASDIPPFICIDEEGGIVSRLFSAGLPGYEAQPSARSVGASGDAQKAYAAGETIGRALSSVGVNVNFAPVADVLTNPRNTVIGSRSYGSDPALVGEMASAFQAGLHSRGIMSAPKHFPGHGNTASDSHFTSAVIASSLEHLAAVEYIPFIRLIGEGAQFIMTGHVTAPGIEPDGLPATLSRYFITEVLRGELGFSGVVVTDAMNMRAITRTHPPGEAAVAAFLAGVDMILQPADFDAAAAGMTRAAGEGVITEGRIDESLTRIFRAKITAGLITLPGG